MAQVHYVVGSRDRSAALARWLLVGPLDWREWDGEFVVRVDGSGTTCILSALAGETIKALRNGATYVEDIAAQVFADADEQPHAATAALMTRFSGHQQDTQRVLDTLTGLAEAGIVRSDLT